MTNKPVTQPQDKYVLRMPDGLRDRIKVYAERQGTSMNFEIVRVLEREWPEQWPIESRLSELAEMVTILKAGKADPRIEDLVKAFQDTVEGIITGRVTGVDLETREAVEDMWREYQDRQHEYAVDAYHGEYDEEEQRTKDLIGRPEKYAEPPPEKPNPVRDEMLLMDLMPPAKLTELTKKLSEADIDGAKEVLAGLDREEVLRRIRQRSRTASHREAPPISDPFSWEK